MGYGPDNLAAVLVYRIRGERGKNLEEAIHHYLDALKVRTRTILP